MKPDTKFAENLIAKYLTSPVGRQKLADVSRSLMTVQQMPLPSALVFYPPELTEDEALIVSVIDS